MAMNVGPGSGSQDPDVMVEINTTPLIDVMLVLLIIFMVTSSVIADAGARSGLRVNLPKGATKEVNPGSKDLTVAIGPDGKRNTSDRSSIRAGTSSITLRIR